MPDPASSPQQGYNCPDDYGRDWPDSEAVDAWARREHRRRRAWSEGPTEHEKREWARSERAKQSRDNSGLTLEPTDQEVAEWADRERKRRQAWLQGPAAEERRDWAEDDLRRRRAEEGSAALPTTDADVEEWADRERRRRQAWAEGPTEEEKRDWARREESRWDSWGRYDYGYPPRSPYSSEDARRAMREAERAVKGAWSWLAEWPYRVWDGLLAEGRRVEERSSGPLRRRRIGYYD